MNTRLPLVTLCLFPAILLAQPARLPDQEPARTRIQYLSGTGKDDAVPWEFFCTANRKAGQWTTIPVPSCWECQGFGNFHYRFDDPKLPFEEGKYKHAFKIPSQWSGSRVAIVFDGVMTDAQVQINGQSAGPRHQGAFYRFRYDITDKLKFGDEENLLEVTVTKHSADESINRAERQGDYWLFGGIFRPVWLEAVPPQFIERVAIDAKADGTFNIDVYPQGLKGRGAVEVDLSDPVTKTLIAANQRKTFDKLDPGKPVRVSFKVENPKLWTAETPNLYWATVRLYDDPEVRAVHQVRQRFGFRTIEVKAGDGIYVNSKRIIMKGICRHSAWPDSGRTTSRKLSEMDVELMKQMNMNAVRMSHYPPDEHFLETCDEKGLYVLDELAGWQKCYDAGIGRKLIGEMVPRDVNHPSIILWDNGNEGGWNREIDDEFARWDPQQREVIHPWEKFGKINTKHYPTYDQLLKLLDGPDIVMPTEFLHGLYDGGHGAGMADYWTAIRKSKVGAGGFLWVFADEGVKRDDLSGAIDVAGNQAPDGILGPYREKEGSFYTIREIWSPVQMSFKPEQAFGLPSVLLHVSLENRYDFTNLRQCKFEWELREFDSVSGEVRVLEKGVEKGPNVAPGQTGEFTLLPKRAHAVAVRAIDPSGREIWTAVWVSPALRWPSRDLRGAVPPVDDGDAYKLAAQNGTVARIDKKTGSLLSFSRNGKSVPLTGGPRLVSGQWEVSEVVKWERLVVLRPKGDLQWASWTMSPEGRLEFEFGYSNSDPAPVLGITFNFPENQIKSHRWLGKGPYRVWKNRMEGGFLSVHETPFNDTQTGYKDWIYPEFKGYFADWHWSRLKTDAGTLTIGTETPGLFLRLGTPAEPDKKLLQKCTTVFPPGNLSFLHGIAPIGNKFHKASDTGPQGQLHPPGGPYKGTVFFMIED